MTQSDQEQDHRLRARDRENHGASETGRRAMAETLAGACRPAPQRGVGQILQKG